MLISCIMPTYNRRPFIPQALKYFERQDYPDKELIIVDDGEDKIEDLVPTYSNIRYVSLSERCNVGMKRNIACSLARGEVICCFDDDDYYGPQRLTKQVAPILDGQADASAMRMSLLLDVRQGMLWTCDEMTHRLCFKQDIHYGTLLFRAAYWQNGAYFPSVCPGEDVRFVHGLLAQGAHIARVVDPASFAYILHGSNTTTDMRLVHPEGWVQMDKGTYLSPVDRVFYHRLKETMQGEQERMQPSTAETNAEIAHMKGLL